MHKSGKYNNRKLVEVCGAESAGYNACGGADDAGAVQERCRGGAGGAGAVQGVQGRCRLPAPSAPPPALYPVQGGAGGAGTPQTFGWRRSAEVFSHTTASIVVTFTSTLAKATFLKPSINASTDHLSPALQKLLADTLPPHSHSCKAHVDDFAIVDIMQNNRSVGAEKDLFWAIKAHLRHGSISIKKFFASSF